MQVSLEWFEAVCQDLSRNPVGATKSIESFRDSDMAVEACKSFLVSGSATFVAKFQAVSVLQIAYLGRWVQFQKHEHDSMKNMLSLLISNSIATQNNQNSTPSYLTNKLIQVFVSFWKHDWLECERHEKEQFFQIISTLLKTSDHMKSGTILLESVLEEFSTKSFAESNLSFEKHIQIKKAFQSTDLQRVFILSVESISVVFQAISATTNGDGGVSVQTHFRTLAELLKLLVEVISWDFSLSSTVTSKRGGGDEDNRRGGQVHVQYNKLPREWSAYLIQPTFIDSIYAMYKQLLLFAVSQPHSPSGVSFDATRDIETCLLETRNLVLCLSSMNGDIFADPSEQVAMAGYIVGYSIQLVEGSSCRLDLQTAVANGQLSLTAPSYETGGVRYRELELFLSTVFRLLSNFKVAVLRQMTNFTSMLVTLSSIAMENSSELLVITQDMMSRVTAITAQSGPNSAVYEQQLRCAYDTPVLDTWRGEVLTTVVDIWTALLEDSTVQELISCSSGSRDPQFRSFVVGLSEQLFPSLFESLLNVYIFESVLSSDEEEDEDDVVIAARSVEDVLMGVCMIGRVSFVRNSSLLSSFLSSAATEISQLFAAQQNGQGTHNTSNLIVLEKLRITLLFTSYLFVDNFHENSDEVDHEAVSIGALVLDSLCSDSAQTVSTLNQMVQNVVNLLQFQMSVLGSVNGVCNDLLSPMLLQLVFRFTAEYLSRFVDADTGVYSREMLQTLPQLSQIHGAEFNSTLEVLLSAVPHILTYLPLETELIVNIAETVTALSKSGNVHRLQFVVSLPSIATVAQILTNQHRLVPGSTITVPCRLSAVGNSTFFEALGTLLVKAREEPFFTQLCTSVYTQCSSIAVSNGHDAEALMERSLSSLSGLARCPSGLDPVLHSLFDGCFPVLKASILKHSSSDVLLKLYLGLLRDFAEVQLSRLNNNSCFELYKSSFELLQIYAKRFAASDLHSANMDEEAVHFKNESCWVLLELLNHLSSRDFSFSEDCSDALNRSFDEEVASVLLFGLQVMSPVVTVDILRAFPLTADKYFSFVAFITGTYIINLVQWLNGLSPEEGRRRLFDIVQHLLWGPGSYDAATARQALQALQSIGINQHKAMQNPQRFSGLSPVLHSEVLLLVLDRLLEIVLLPQGREHDLAWDRVDALGNTLITFIALDTQRFQQVGSALVARHAQQSVQQTLFEGLGKLSTDRRVALNSTEKANRQLFVANFREFVTSVKGLNLK